MKDTIEHKGYLGKAEVDFEDGCIYASIANAKGLYLTAEGNTPTGVKSAFKSIVDDYLMGAEANSWAIIEPNAVAVS